MYAYKCIKVTTGFFAQHYLYNVKRPLKLPLKEPARLVLHRYRLDDQAQEVQAQGVPAGRSLGGRLLPLPSLNASLPHEESSPDCRKNCNTRGMRESQVSKARPNMEGGTDTQLCEGYQRVYL